MKKMKRQHSAVLLVLGSLMSGTLPLSAQGTSPNVIVQQSAVRTGKPSPEIAEVVAIMEDVHSIRGEQTQEFLISTGDVIESSDATNVVIVSGARINSVSDRGISVKFPSGLVRQFSINAKTRLCDGEGIPIKPSSLATNELVAVRWMAAKTGTKEKMSKGIDALSIRKGALKYRFASSSGEILITSGPKLQDCSCPANPADQPIRER